MVTVAIAAGSGHVGRTIVSVLRNSPKHKVVILSRKAAETDDPKAPTYVVDYSNIDAVAKILEDNNVHTVVSAILVMSAEAGEAERNLVKAAVMSAPTQRFISSDWTSPRPKANPQPFRQATLEALRQTDLEFTAFQVGYFADYLGMPHVQSHLLPVVGNIDMAHCQAAIPGDGHAVHAYTYTFDLARFVEAALDLPEGEWEEETYCWSDKVTFNQIVKMAEEARGTKFSVVYDSVEKIEAGEVTELPGHVATYAYYPKPLFQQAMAFFELCIVQGLLDFPAEKSLNRKFPDLKTAKVKDMLDAWKGEMILIN